MKVRLAIVLVALFGLILILPFFASQVWNGTSTNALYVHAEGATIWTDKGDYNPEETVTIFGSGFLANTQVMINVTAPDLNVTTIYATTDESSAFTAYYTLDGMGGTYTVVATDGTNTATTTFTDTTMYFTATISPTTAIAGETKSYTITIQNYKYNSPGVVLGSATIAIPSGFTSLSIISVSYPYGKPWTATLDSGYIKLNATADSYKLSRGQSVSVTFSATAPGTAGIYTWTTRAWTDRACGNELFLKPMTTQPKVTVSGGSTVSITITSNPATGSSFIKVDSTAYNTPHTFTWTVGTTHTLQALSPVSGGTGIQYVYTSWSASSFGSSTSQTYTYTVPSSAETVTANYKTQYQHTITSSPATGSGYVTVDGSAVTTPYTTPWWDSGSSHTIAANSPVTLVSGQSRYIYSSWSDSGAQSHSVSPTTVTTYTANFQLQYYLSVTGGNNPIGAGWYNSGVSATASSTWIWNTVAWQSRMALTNWQLDTVNQNPSRSNTGDLTTSSIIMSAYHVVNFVSTTQYYLTVTGGNSITYGMASPTSDNWYDSGQSTTVSSNWVWDIVSGQSRYALTNWQLDGGNQNPTRQYSGTLTTSSITMSTYHTVNFVSTIQYYFSVSSAYDSPTGQAWYDAGSSISSTVTRPISGGTGIQYETTGWTGTGSLSSGGTTGSSSTGSFTINAYSTCTWNWKTQYLVHYAASGNVLPVTVPADEWVNSGTGATGVFPAQVTDTGIRCNYVSDNRPSVPPGITAPTTVTATYQTQYYLTMSTNFGTVSPVSGWYNEGAVVSISATAPSAGSGEQYVWNGWTGTGTINYTGSAISSSVTMNSPITETASWTHQFLLTIKTSGLPSAYPTNVYLAGSQVGTASDTSSYTKWFDAEALTGTIGVDNTISGATDTQYVFVKWVEDSSANNPRASETMSSSKTFTAEYKTQYKVSFTQTGSGVAPTVTYDADTDPTQTVPFSVWVKAGSEITYAYQNTVLGASGVRYVLLSTTPLSPQTVNSPLTIIGSYKTQYQITVTASPSGALGGTFKVTYTQCGTTYTNVLKTTSWTEWADGATTVMVSEPQNIVNGYKFDSYNPSATVTMDQAKTVTLIYTAIPAFSVTISPASAAIKVGESVSFTSTVSGGVPSYSYQWYRNGTAVSGAIYSTWTFTPTTSGTYNIYLNVTDSTSKTVKSNVASVTVAPPLIVSISPTSATILVGQSVGFTSTVSGGYPGYSYQWYLGGVQVSGATTASWTFTSTTSGVYYVYLQVKDANNNIAQSETAKITVTPHAPVGGYSISLAKRTPISQIAAYTLLIALFGAALSLGKRKRK